MLYEILFYINNNLDELDVLFEKLIHKFAYDNNDNNINSIKFIMMDKFKYNPLQRTEEIKKLTNERIGQYKFRENLILRDKKCLITNDSFEICEACHIIPYCENKIYDVSNGILLNRCLHKMFDNYKFSINNNNCIEFNNHILNNFEYKNYHIYDNKQINIYDDMKYFIKLHYENFIKINNN